MRTLYNTTEEKYIHVEVDLPLPRVGETVIVNKTTYDVVNITYNVDENTITVKLA
jgi:hypothetical protein